MTTAPALSLVDRGPPPRCPDHFNMAAYVLSAAQTTPDKPALELIVSPGTAPETWSFADLAEAVQGTMSGLEQAGLRPGDPLFLYLGNTLDFPILFFAATGLGACPVPLSPALTQAEVRRAAELIRPRLMATAAPLEGASQTQITPDEFRPWRALPPAAFASTRADDPAYIVFTSGTGGQPRAVLHAHRAAFARRMMWPDWYGLGQDDRLMHAGAFNWTYTLGTGLTDPWAAGATALIYAGPPDRGIWSAVARHHNPTLFAAAPGVFRQLLSTGTVTTDAFATLRHALSAGDSLPPSLAAAWVKASGKPILEALGMSEISTYISHSPDDPAFRPQRGRRVALLDPQGAPVPQGQSGEIAVAATDPGLMLGYLEDGTAHLPLTNGWFRTGDIGVMDHNGSLRHMGRLGDLLNVQGYRVSAREVEDVLRSHKDVADVAVTAVAVRDTVEVIAAFVVPTKPDSLSGAELQTHCQAQLARYKCPRVFRFMDTLPKTATGKTLKRRLAETFVPDNPPT